MAENERREDLIGWLDFEETGLESGVFRTWAGGFLFGSVSRQGK